MSKAFQCDICGECVSLEDDAKSAREIARESTDIFGMNVELYILIGVAIAHTCDVCWAEVMRKVKIWVDNHLGD